jgi:16S rRNA processing protein RimM
LTDRLIVGRVAKAHGIKGEVAIEIHTDVPEIRFAPGAHLRADPDIDLTVATSREHQGRVLVRFESVPDRNGAEALRGRWLSIDAADLQPLDDPWSFWGFELEGAAVTDTTGTKLGTFVGVQEGKVDDLWIVRTPNGNVLVPAVKQIVVSVDVGAKQIVLDPPEGLFP